MEQPTGAREKAPGPFDAGAKAHGGPQGGSGVRRLPGVARRPGTCG